MNRLSCVCYVWVLWNRGIIYFSCHCSWRLCGEASPLIFWTSAILIINWNQRLQIMAEDVGNSTTTFLIHYAFQAAVIWVGDGSFAHLLRLLDKQMWNRISAQSDILIKGQEFFLEKMKTIMKASNVYRKLPKIPHLWKIIKNTIFIVSLFIFTITTFVLNFNEEQTTFIILR